MAGDDLPGLVAQRGDDAGERAQHRLLVRVLAGVASIIERRGIAQAHRHVARQGDPARLEVCLALRALYVTRSLKHVTRGRHGARACDFVVTRSLDPVTVPIFATLPQDIRIGALALSTGRGLPGDPLDRSHEVAADGVLHHLDHVAALAALAAEKDALPGGDDELVLVAPAAHGAGRIPVVARALERWLQALCRLDQVGAPCVLDPLIECRIRQCHCRPRRSGWTRARA